MLLSFCFLSEYGVKLATATDNQPKNEQSADALSDSFFKVRTSAPKSRIESYFNPAFSCCV